MTDTIRKLLDDAWDACNTGPVDMEELSERITKALKRIPSVVLDAEISEDDQTEATKKYAVYHTDTDGSTRKAGEVYAVSPDHAVSYVRRTGVINVLYAEAIEE